MQKIENKVEKSAFHPPPLTHLATLPDKRHVFSKGRTLFIGTGSLFEQVSNQYPALLKATDSGPAKYIPGSKRYACVSYGQGKQQKYVFKGKLARMYPDAAVQMAMTTAMAAYAVNSSSTSSLRDKETKQPSLASDIQHHEKKKKSPRKKMTAEDAAELDAALKHVKAMKESGVQAKVSIRTFSLASGKSIPTLYRKMKEGICPRPQKMGRQSAWVWDEVEDYINGTYVSADARA